MRKKENIKIIFKYLFLFVLFLGFNLFIQPLNLDEVWNYGFGHNIYSGLIPYKDFNMVLTPLYSMIMALFFFVFGSNMLVFHIVQALISTWTCYFLFKFFKDKAWLLILFLFIPWSISFPSYNLFLFSLFVVVLYLEKNKGNDYLIGLLLGGLILTKQSVGVCLLLPSFYYIKDKEKIIKRVIGCFIPLALFVIYLIGTNSFNEFLDLCVFGLFDFASGNGKRFNIYVVLTGIIVMMTLYFIKKDPRDIKNYYVLAFYSVIVPLFDAYHFQIGFLAFLMLLLFNDKIQIKLNYKLFSIGIILGISLMIFWGRFYKKEIIYPNDIKHFEYRLLDKNSILLTKEVNEYIVKNKNREFVFLNSNGYYFRLVNDMKIGYLDLINTGNWGFKGSDKMLDAIKKKSDAIFIVDKSELSPIKQIDKRILNYVIKNGKKIDSIKIYDIYVMD